MPQVSTNKVEGEGQSFTEMLKKLSQDLEGEICTALLLEDNPLAERLTKIRTDLNRLR